MGRSSGGGIICCTPFWRILASSLSNLWISLAKHSICEKEDSRHLIDDISSSSNTDNLGTSGRSFILFLFSIAVSFSMNAADFEISLLNLELILTWVHSFSSSNCIFWLSC